MQQPVDRQVDDTKASFAKKLDDCRRYLVDMSNHVPVYRAYNNGFARSIDSNHQITSNAASYQAQIAKGWSGGRRDVRARRLVR